MFGWLFLARWVISDLRGCQRRNGLETVAVAVDFFCWVPPYFRKLRRSVSTFIILPLSETGWQLPSKSLQKPSRQKHPSTHISLHNPICSSHMSGQFVPHSSNIWLSPGHRSHAWVMVMVVV